MQEAERSIRPEGAPTDKGPVSSPSRRGVAPLVAFGVLLVVIAAVVLLVQLTGEDTATPPTSDDAPADTAPATTTLTDEEAIEEFLNLSRLSSRAGRDRDLSLLPSIFTSTGPLKSKARELINQLLEDHVLERSDVETRDVTVLSSTASEVRLRETRWIRPCYVAEDGEDVTDGPAVLEQIRTWILRRESDRWMLHNSIIEKARVVDKTPASCA